MTKYTKMLSRVVTISTYAIIFCVIGNMVMPALIVESVHAQTVASSATTAQAQADAAKKAYEKIQADAKQAGYKDLGLTKSEITFSEDKTFDMDVINQKVDKYVSYNKNGLASLNADGYRKDATVKLSKSNTEIVISIANKQIEKYNAIVTKSRNIISTSQAGLSNGVKASTVSNQVDTNANLTITVLNRGVKMSVEFNSLQTNSKAGLVSASNYVAGAENCSDTVKKIETYNYWWGTDTRSVLNDCLAQHLSFLINIYGGSFVLVGTVACTLTGILVPLCVTVIGVLALYMGVVSYALTYYGGRCTYGVSLWMRSPWFARNQLGAPTGIGCY